MSVKNLKSLYFTGGRVKAEFCDAIVTVWVAPRDLWEVLSIAENDKGKEIPEGYILGQVAEDGPYRILKLAR